MLVAQANSSPDSALGHYVAKVRKYPLLSREREEQLVERWLSGRDAKALDELAGSHLRLVIKLARGYRAYGLPFDDLISEGNLGLMQAIERFDPALGFRLNTYAVWWIRAQLQDYVMRASSLVRIGTTAAQKRLFFNLRRLAAAHGELQTGELSPETVAAIARELGVREREVVEMGRRMARRDASLNERLDADGEAERQDFLVDDAADQETELADAEELQKRRGSLAEAMGKLSPRECHILAARRLSDEPPTLEDLGTHFGVSRERVRQIEARALEKLGKAMRAGNAARAASAAA